MRSLTDPFRPDADGGEWPLRVNQILNFPNDEHWRRRTIEDSIACEMHPPTQ